MTRAWLTSGHCRKPRAAGHRQTLPVESRPIRHLLPMTARVPAAMLPPSPEPRAARERRDMDLLIRNARVWDDRPLVDIGIDGERIVAIDTAIDAEAGRVIDAGGRAVLPGFVEPHLHL